MDNKHHGKHLDTSIIACYAEGYSDRKATLVEVCMSIDGEVFIGTGSSHRVAGDAYDERTGHLLALTRAVEDVLTKLKEQARKIH